MKVTEKMESEVETTRRCRVTVWNWRNEIVAEFGDVDEAWRFVCADPELQANCLMEIKTLRFAL